MVYEAIMSMKSITSLAKKIFFISKAVILLHFYLDIMPTRNAKILSDSEQTKSGTTPYPVTVASGGCNQLALLPLPHIQSVVVIQTHRG